MATVNDLINSQPNVIQNTIISASNVSDDASASHLTQALNTLLGIVTKNINNIAYDHDTSINHQNNPDRPQKNTIISADELNTKKQLINSLANDCICYADCTAFAKWKYTTCSCNCDCKCNYG